MSSLFADPRMAVGYASARPPVHQRVIDRARAWLGASRMGRAADVGCGAGLSTEPLIALADQCVGFDPAEAMVALARRRVPRARFVAGTAEAMPLASASVDLLTAAGSLNYADLDRFFPEAARVLAPAGSLVVYDFSPGRWFPGSGRLEVWFDAFMRRYPPPEGRGRSLSPAELAGATRDFVLRRGEDFEVGLPMTTEIYVAYMLTETNVEHAVRGGASLEGIRAWCTETLAPVFDGATREVLFRGYVAQLVPAPGA
jgi:SAM-dependent methyltransferase